LPGGEVGEDLGDLGADAEPVERFVAIVGSFFVQE
jgi:hypothetical protein